MMTEQTVTLNSNEELQCKWKYCIGVACSVAKIVDIFTDFFEAVYEAFKKVAETLYGISEEIYNIFKDLNFRSLLLYSKELAESSYRKVKQRPPKFCGIHKINTRGFTAPILKCARSRC